MGAHKHVSVEKDTASIDFFSYLTTDVLDLLGTWDLGCCHTGHPSMYTDLLPCFASQDLFIAYFDLWFLHVIFVLTLHNRLDFVLNLEFSITSFNDLKVPVLN